MIYFYLGALALICIATASTWAGVKERKLAEAAIAEVWPAWPDETE